MPRYIRRSLIALAVLAGVFGLVVVAWAVDTQAHRGKVLRRVTLAGRDVGGLREGPLAAVVAEVAADLDDDTVVVEAPGGGFRTDAESLGLKVAKPATVRSAMRLGRTGTVPARIVEWIRSFRSPRRAPVSIAVDSSAVYATVAALDPGPRRPPVEPQIVFKKGAFEAVEGKPGRGIDPAAVIAELPKAANSGDRIVVRVDRGEVDPRFPVDDAERLAGEVQAKVSVPIKVAAGGETATIPVSTLRSWVESDTIGDRLRPRLDGKEALADLRKLLPGAGDPPVETRFVVEGGEVRILAGKAGTQCCSEGAVARLESAVLGSGANAGPTRDAIDLALTERPPKLTSEEAFALNIKEPIASFTTRHKAGEPRVQNIHRIADLVRGSVIEPGKTFSVNDTVGKRTADKGFVSAPVIEEGKFAESVGGGISQFATTLFNAAFEGGLEFASYQSHSIYISRYPYGREATLSYPAPDLAIKNPSPHGVLIWPTYTGTTITVTLWSTKFVDVRQSGQSEAPRGACKRVTTERTRTFLSDGHTQVDKVFATYRPEEGVNC